MCRGGTLLTLVALLALPAVPARAQSDQDREQLRKELIQQLDSRLRKVRAQLIREIDRKLGVKGKKKKAAPKHAVPQRKPQARPFLGIAIKELRPGLRELLGIPGKQGVMVDHVADGSSAERAGIRRTDVIVSWGGKPVGSKEQLIGYIRSQQVGDKVTVVLYRSGRRLEVPVTLNARPGEQELERQAAQPRRGSRPDKAEQDLERFLDKALEKPRKPAKRRPRPDAPDMQKMMEQMMGPGGQERMKKMMEQFQGGDFQEMLKRGMKMYEEMMKNPESRKQMEEMMKQFFGGQGGPNQKELQKYLEQMMKNPGGKPEQPARPQQQPGKSGERKRIQKMLDDLLGDGKGKAQPKKTPREQPPVKTGKQGYLGVGLVPLSETLRHQLSLPEGVGVLISQVVKGSPAEKAGLRQYDVIVALGGKKIGELADVRQAIGGKPAGTKLQAVIVRSGKKQTISIELGVARKQEYK